MSEGISHKKTANKIAKQLGTEYTSGQKGADIVTKKIAVEVESPGGMKDAKRQLQGFKTPVYIAATNQQALNEALEATEGTTVGVMDNKGNKIKRSTR